MVTCGGFVDKIKATKNIKAQIFMKKWAAMVSEDKSEGELLVKYRSTELTKELFLDFAKKIAALIQERIATTCTKALYSGMIKYSHAFLKEIHAKAVEMGIKVELEEVNIPLTITESLIKNGAAKLSLRTK